MIMKNTCLSILLSCMTHLIFSQNTIVDSLKKVAEKLPADTNKVNTFNRISIELQESDFKESLQYAEQSLQLAEQLKFKKGISSAYNSIAVAYNVHGDLSKCLEFHKKALELRLQIGSSAEISTSNNNLGNAYSDLGDFDKSLEYYEIARAIDEKSNDKKSLTFVYNNIGVAYTQKGELKKAIDFIYKSLRLKEELGNIKGAANSANNIAVIYKMQGDFKEALNYNNKALAFRMQLKDSLGIGYSYFNLGVVYRNLNDLVSAETNYLKALAIFNRIGHKKGIASVNNNLGVIYKTNKQLDKAMAAYSIALSMFEEIQDKNGLAIAYSSIASVYGAKGNTREADKYFEKSEVIAKQGGGFELLMEVYDLKSVYYKERNDYKQALKYYELYSTAKDSLRGKESIAALAETKTKYETEKKESENKLLLQENNIKTLENASSKKTIFMLIAGIFLALVAILWLISVFRIRKQKQAIETQKQLQKDRERISRDLHDNVGGQLSYVLFSLEGDEANTLAERKEKSSNLSTAVRSVTSNLRETIWALNQDHLSLRDIGDKLKVYARNMFSYSDVKVKFEECIENDTDLNPAFALNLFRICQEAINNVFKHAHASELTIHLSRLQQIEITIIDNGLGFNQESKDKNSYGLSNLNARADEIKATLQVHSQLNKGTQVKIVV
jgi:signal transduction histidine kinase